MLGMNEFSLANWFFAVGDALLFIKIATWPEVCRKPFGQRITIILVASIAAIVLFAKEISWVKGKQSSVGGSGRIHEKAAGKADASKQGQAVQPALGREAAVPRAEGSAKRTGLPQPFTFREKSPEFFTVIFGRVTNRVSRSMLRQRKWNGLIVLNGVSLFSLYEENDVLYVDTRVYAGQGQPVVEIVRNTFVVRPPAWDRNFTANALEVVDSQARPVLQMVRKTNSIIEIKGAFSVGDSVFVSDDRGMYMGAGTGFLRPFDIKPIFKYPSWKYLGENAQ